MTRAGRRPKAPWRELGRALATADLAACADAPNTDLRMHVEACAWMRGELEYSLATYARAIAAMRAAGHMHANPQAIEAVCDGWADVILDVAARRAREARGEGPSRPWEAPTGPVRRSGE